MSPFYINIVHRPEMVPEYIQKEAERGKIEDLTRQGVFQESLNIFRKQQKIAHDCGLRTTIQMTYASLFNNEAVSIAKEHAKKYGDEIGLTFLGLQSMEFRKKFHSRELAIWLFSYEEKQAIVRELFERFHQVFGFYPTSTGSYFMDAELVNFIKKEYPMVQAAIATCWEEGPKAYHNANNSWYTIFDGSPWNPWIPSKRNIHCPASDDEDDIGIVALPHISRDLMAVFDGPGSYYGTHPQNILRGMVYEDREIPYFNNIVDQYRSMARYNHGFAYNMMIVGPGWMSKQGRWEADYDLLEKSYTDGMSYYGQLKKDGLAVDLTLSEFAAVFRKSRSYNQPECSLWKDILYGSQRQQFWFVDPWMRFCLDMNQGGAMIDFRPYIAKLDRPCGAGTTHLQDASYPFLVQSMYRAGFFTHYAGEGSVKSCKVGYRGEEVDLCTCRTQANCKEEEGRIEVILEPVEIRFEGLTIWMQTQYVFAEGCGEIEIIRTIVDSTDLSEEVIIDEYITACYGTTEYPEDMQGIQLSITSPTKTEKIEYAYKSRECSIETPISVEAVIPQVKTLLKMYSRDGEYIGYFREGFMFSPMFTLGIKKTIKGKGQLRTWLKVEKVG